MRNEPIITPGIERLRTNAVGRFAKLDHVQIWRMLRHLSPSYKFRSSVCYTFRTSNFDSGRGGAWVSDKGYASMDLA
ncbi:MAG: hypothetical protein CVV06_14605 [Gammaproteobacteria bacterium HGW-Gammaproteobacteria-10]|nr:MAG: hypothetical protein CVV06_14605 [Gammaproteobacteria bacterium HGW-Gammaproteobacteria-10]